MKYLLTKKEIQKLSEGKLKLTKVIPQNRVFIPITGKDVKHGLANKKLNLEEINKMVKKRFLLIASNIYKSYEKGIDISKFK